MKYLEFLKPDEKGNIDVPDELMPLFDKIGMQFRFHKLSGKNEILAIAHCCQLAQDFFMQNPELIKNSEQQNVCGGCGHHIQQCNCLQNSKSDFLHSINQ